MEKRMMARVDKRYRTREGKKILANLNRLEAKHSVDLRRVRGKSINPKEKGATLRALIKCRSLSWSRTLSSA
jgi:hypothetical protein